MKNLQKKYLAGACLLFLLACGTAQAKSNSANKNSISKMELQRAYQQLLLSKETHRFSGKSKKRAQSLHLQKPSIRNRVLTTARQQLRKRYRWGGASPRRGFDCSGLVQYAYKSAHVKLPRTAAEQYRYTKRVPLSRLKVGDLIFFHTRRRSRSRVNHVGIYMGGGNFIHAPRRGKRVSISKLDRYWKRRVVGAGRV